MGLSILSDESVVLPLVPALFGGFDHLCAEGFEAVGLLPSHLIVRWRHEGIAPFEDFSSCIVGNTPLYLNFSEFSLLPPVRVHGVVLDHCRLRTPTGVNAAMRREGGLPCIRRCEDFGMTTNNRAAQAVRDLMLNDWHEMELLGSSIVEDAYAFHQRRSIFS